MKSIELFAGGGGLTLGLHQAGVIPQVVAEWDTDSCSTLRANLLDDSGLRLATDIRTVNFREWQDRVELVTYTSPLQL